jgi:hypothetical protein
VEAKVDAVSNHPTWKKFNTSLDPFLGKDTILLPSPLSAIGELEEALPHKETPRTIFPGTKTSTFLNIAVHAGLRDLLLPLLIDSTSTTTLTS